MSTTSNFIKMTLQALDENPDTWGDVLNVSALELLEDAIAGTATATVTSGDVALNEDAGTDNDPHYRMMIIDVQGSPGVARNVTCPATSQVYLVANNSDSDVTFKTTAGTGITISSGDATWAYCDGTNILGTSVANATTATTATTATNATQLGGVAAANYAQLGVAQTWTKGQVIQAASVSVTGAGPYDLQLDMNDSTSFYHETTQNFTLQAPSNAVVGHSFSLLVEQGATGPHTIAFPSNTYIATGTPSLSTSVGDIDLISAEYSTIAAGNRWVISIIKGLSAV